MEARVKVNSAPLKPEALPVPKAFDVQCRLSRHQNEVQYIGQQGRNMTTAMTGVGQKVQTAFFGIAVLIRG